MLLHLTGGNCVVKLGSEEVPIADYLNESLPSIYCYRFVIDGEPSIYRREPAQQPFENNSFETVDWDAAGVEYASEKTASAGRRSIFDWLRARLVAPSDAGAYFVTMARARWPILLPFIGRRDGPRVKMSHCKASELAAPGNRSKDLEIVFAQAIKSCVWISPEHFYGQLRHRVTLPSVAGYYKGDEATVAAILEPRVQQQIQFETFIVQPGVMREGRAERLSNMLAAARDFLKDAGVFHFGVIGS